MKRDLISRKTELLHKLQYIVNDNAARRISREVLFINQTLKRIDK